jgi:hypothetical protein
MQMHYFLCSVKGNAQFPVRFEIFRLLLTVTVANPPGCLTSWPAMAPDIGRETDEDRRREGRIQAKTPYNDQNSSTGSRPSSQLIMLSTR